MATETNSASKPATPFLALDLLQSMGKVQKYWVSGTILVVSKYKTGIIVHALPNKKLKVIELWKKELGCSLNEGELEGAGARRT